MTYLIFCYVVVNKKLTK